MAAGRPPCRPDRNRDRHPLSLSPSPGTPRRPAVHGCQDIGPDYAVTLRAWREAWEARQAEVLALGYSERFWRKYRFYFAYCEAAFDAR